MSRFFKKHKREREQYHYDREKAVLLALQMDMGLLRKGFEVHAMHTDGSTEVIGRGATAHELWHETLQELQRRQQKSPLKEAIAEHPPATHLRIYTDGGSRGNPGPSASGYVIMDQDDHVLEEGGQYLGITTNNQAEYGAVKLALEAVAKFQPRELDVYLDSQLVVNQLTGLYKLKSKDLQPAHEAIRNLSGQFDRIEFHHVYREFNTLADAQVNRILDKEASKNSQNLLK